MKPPAAKRRLIAAVERADRVPFVDPTVSEIEALRHALDCALALLASHGIVGWTEYVDIQ